MYYLRWSIPDSREGKMIQGEPGLKDEEIMGPMGPIGKIVFSPLGDTEAEAAIAFAKKEGISEGDALEILRVRKSTEEFNRSPRGREIDKMLEKRGPLRPAGKIFLGREDGP